MTANFYFHINDAELRAEDAGESVRIVAGNFDWTMLLENRLDCARWAKAIADADALFVRRTLETSWSGPTVSAAEGATPVNAPGPGHTRDEAIDIGIGAAIETVSYDPHPGASGQDFGADDLEPLPPLPQRTPAGPPEQPWQAAMHELDPEALAGAVPLESLAPEPQKDEAQA